MADRIERNDEREFAGCIVLIPPPTHDSGDLFELLLINPTQEASFFWHTVKNRCTQAADDWVNHQQNPMGGYR